MTRPPSPTEVGLILASLPLLVAMAILASFRLGMARRLAVASARMAVQLTLLALVLGRIFEVRSPWAVSAAVLAMLLASAQVLGGRGRRGSALRLRIEGFLAISLGAAIVLSVSIALGLGLRPWYQPSVVIPLAGMILGNSVSGVALAVERLEGDLMADRDLVELRLALGASAFRAALPALRAALRAALTPTTNSMRLAGIVSIPGMATGQILAGSGVGEAIRYQILIYFAITATVTLSTLTLLAARLRDYFTDDWQLRIDRPGNGDDGPRSAADAR